MNVFGHHIYEYEKGLRRLVLHTTRADLEVMIIQKLKKRRISYLISKVSDTKINVFFGASYCIDVLKTFPHLKLSKLTPELDFILGAMLGYDMKLHCRRYLSTSKRRLRGTELQGSMAAEIDALIPM